MLIEILGPSGVGKTSILSGVQEKWKPWKWENASGTTLPAVFWEREPD